MPKWFAVTTAVVSLCALTAAAGDSAYAKSRQCPSFVVSVVVSDYQSKYRIKPRIVRGNASCKTARGLFRSLYRGEGRLEIAPGAGRGTTYIRGWRCTTGAGGAGCWRPGRDSTKARDRISADVDLA